MSADIWLIDPDTGEQVVTDPDPDAEMRAMVPYRSPASTDDTSFNLTYNLSRMLWGAGMPAWREFIGMNAAEAGLIWEATVTELERDPDLYRTLNPENGWGTYEQAVEVLSALAAACARHPSAEIGGWL